MSLSNKMDKKEDLLENFKTAITSTIKSISDSDDVEVSFGDQNLKVLLIHSSLISH